ncbi:MAG: thiamine pyrophosphate-binding protein [Chloroflexi bacterium]|nr:thiamine pyrophosphate-binding protein [Chloroflexota bacterium]
MPSMTGGEAVLQSLGRHQIDTIFGIAGNQLGAFYDAWIDHPEIREVGVRHEQGAAYMALGYAWSTGRPGVCATIGGPGALNTACAMATAASANIPVLLMSGQVISSQLGEDKRAPHQLYGQTEIFRKLLKGVRVAHSVTEIPDAVSEAFYVMSDGVPGPFELELPRDVLGAKADIRIPEPITPTPPQPSDRAVLESIAEEIAKASRPAILAGFGAVLSGASKEVRALAEMLKAPVYTSFKSKGIIAEDDPHCMGATGEMGGITSPFDPDADLILALGTRINVWSKGPRALPKGKRVIQIDVDRSAFGAVYPVAVPVLGDLRQTLIDLLPLLKARRLACTDRDWQALRQERIETMRQAAPESVPLLERLRDVLPRNTIVTADVTGLAG